MKNMAGHSLQPMHIAATLHSIRIKTKEKTY